MNRQQAAAGLIGHAGRQVMAHVPGARRAVRRLRQWHTVSVVIPVHNVEEYIDASLSSLRAQTYETLQIIVVDDGSTDGSAAIYRRHAAEDRRFLLLSQKNAGQGAARNHGLRYATGRYVTFLDPDDLLPPRAYATMVAALQRSGSDFVLGSVRRTTHGRITSAPWIDLVHARDRIGIGIEDFPEAVMDVICCNRMFHRSFWDAAGLGFPEGVAYEDHVPMMRAFLSAQKFDVLRAVTYHWRSRENLTSTGQRKREVQNLRDRLLAKDTAAGLLQGRSRPVVDAWLRRVLDLDLHGFVRQLEWADEEYWEELQAAVRRFLAAADGEVLAGVRVERKIQAWLLAADRREQLVELLTWLRENPGQLPTEVRGGRVLAAYPPLAAGRSDDSAPPIPEHIRQLTDHESRLMASLRAATIEDEGVLRLSGWAYPRLVDLRDRDVRIEAALVEDRLGLRYGLTVATDDVPEADLVAGHAYQSYRRSGFVIQVPLDELRGATLGAASCPTAPGRLASWRLEIRCTAGQVVRAGVLRSRDGRSSAGFLPSLRDADEVAVVPVHDPIDGLRLDVHRPHAVLRSFVVDGRRISGSVRLLGAVTGSPRLVLKAAGHRAVTTRLSVGSSGEHRFAVELPEASRREGGVPGHRSWTVDLAHPGGGTRLAWPADGPPEWWPVRETGDVVAHRTERGDVEIYETRNAAVVEEVTLGDARVQFRGRWLGSPPAGWRAHLRDADADEPVTTWTAEEGTAPDGSEFRCAFRLTGGRPAGTGDAMPPRSHLLDLELSDGAVVVPRMAAALVARTVLSHEGRHGRIQLCRGDAGQPLLRVVPPTDGTEGCTAAAPPTPAVPLAVACAPDADGRIVIAVPATG